MEFDQYTIAVLIRHPEASELDPKVEDQIQDAHMAYLADLHARGILLAAGPFPVSKEENHRGLAILRGTLAEVQPLGEQDPAVLAKRLSYRFLPWLVPKGTLRFSPVRYPRSMAEVGP